MEVYKFEGQGFPHFSKKGWTESSVTSTFLNYVNDNNQNYGIDQDNDDVDENDNDHYGNDHGNYDDNEDNYDDNDNHDYNDNVDN